MKEICEHPGCGKQATVRVVDKFEINGGHVAGKEHLPPMIHHQHAPVFFCDAHRRDPILTANDELHKIRDGWTGAYPKAEPAKAE